MLQLINILPLIIRQDMDSGKAGKPMQRSDKMQKV
jgi:hypothetical protein